MAKKKKGKQFDLLKSMKRHSRLVQLEREKMVGKAVSKTYGGTPKGAAARRLAKRELRKLDDEKNQD